MFNRSMTFVALSLAALGAGCGGVQIQYKPLGTPAAQAKSNVGLQVVDARPADQGGGNKKQIGQVRSGLGIPSGIEDKQDDVAPRTVRDATADALAHAGVGVKDGGGKTLVSTIKSYWMDGYVGYKTTITIHYDLKDAAGKSLWNRDIDGGSGGSNAFSSSKSMAQDMFERALDDLATHAAEQFNSAEFQRAVQVP
jgi:hypothetical protein